MIKTCENWLKNSLSNYILWKNLNNITINFGNFLTGVINTLKSKIPYAKVALVLSQKVYCEYGHKLYLELKKQGHRVVCLILEEQTLDHQNLTKIFALPEDVRAVITFNNEFCGLAKYYCSLSDIIFLSVYTKPDFLECFTNAFYIQDDNVIHQYILKSRSCFIFDVEKIISSPLDINFILLRYCSKLLAPLDYKFSTMLFGEEEKEHKKVCSAIFKIIDKLKTQKDKLDLETFMLLLMLEILNGMTDGKLFDCYSAKIASTNFAVDKKESDELELVFALIYCRLYINALKGLDDEMLDSYSLRLEKVVDLYGVSRTATINEYLRTTKKARKIQLTKQTRKTLLDELDMINKGLNYVWLIYNSYNKPKLKIQKKHLNIGLFAGDLPNRVNGLTLLREKVFSV